MTGIRSAVIAATCGAAVFAAWTVVARADDPAFRPTLHEYIDPPEDSPGVLDPGSGRRTSDVFGKEPGEGNNPNAFRRGDRIVPRPDDDVAPKDNEPVHGRGGFGADRDTEARPDYHTGPDGTLHYIEVYNPSIVPFKRMTALDAVSEDYVMRVYDRSLEDLTVGGETTPTRDMFWASLVVEFEPGEDVAIPSVAPDMRILSYETEPATTVVFAKDGADNYYVRADESGAAGQYRLVFLADADPRYFAPDPPSGYRVRDIDRRRVRPMPTAVRRVAERGMRHIGVHPDMELRDALDKLVFYFRQFEAKDSPPSSGDIYWDLLVSQAGVCRHRSFAFAITANALGIPTRYVANEAHAWVEVWVPDGATGRWLRVDLGGAATTLQVSNAGDKTMYQPRGDDTFPQPPEYSENYTRLEGDVRGLTDAQKRDAHGTMPTDDADPTSGGGLGDGPPGAPSVGPGQKLPQLPPSAYAGKIPTTISIGEVSAAGFRGEAIAVTGRLVQTSGAGVGGQRVDIYLAPQGYDGDYALLVGHTLSLDDGTFDAKVKLPRDLELGDYEVYAASSGDDAFRPALSE